MWVAITCLLFVVFGRLGCVVFGVSVMMLSSWVLLVGVCVLLLLFWYFGTFGVCRIRVGCVLVRLCCFLLFVVGYVDCLLFCLLWLYYLLDFVFAVVWSFIVALLVTVCALGGFDCWCVFMLLIAGFCVLWYLLLFALFGSICLCLWVLGLFYWCLIVIVGCIWFGFICVCFVCYFGLILVVLLWFSLLNSVVIFWFFICSNELLNFCLFGLYLVVYGILCFMTVMLC